MSNLSLSVLSALKGLLTNSELGFKLSVKAESLMAAVIVLLLQYILVLPPLARARVPVVSDFLDQPEWFQFAVVAFALPVMGYLIANLGDLFLGLTTGTALRGSWFGEQLLKRQQHLYDDLLKDLKPEDTAREPTQEELSKVSRAAQRLAQRFPQRRLSLARTTLGNVLLATASYAVQQYGARLDIVLPVLLSTGSKADETKKPSDILNRVESSRETLIFLVSLAVLLAFVIMEVLLVYMWSDELWTGVALAALLVILAWIVYRAAIESAIAWGQNVRLALDRHIKDAEEALNFANLGAEKPEERRRRWEEVSLWMTYGPLLDNFSDPAEEGNDKALFSPLRDKKNGRMRYTIPRQNPTWYKASEQPTATATQGFAVVFQPKKTAGWVEVYSADGTCRIYGQGIDYLLLVTNTAAQPANGYVLVSDPRVSMDWLEVTGERKQAAPAPPTRFAELLSLQGGFMAYSPSHPASGHQQPSGSGVSEDCSKLAEENQDVLVPSTNVIGRRTPDGDFLWTFDNLAAGATHVLEYQIVKPHGGIVVKTPGWQVTSLTPHPCYDNQLVAVVVPRTDAQNPVDQVIVELQGSDVASKSDVEAYINHVDNTSFVDQVIVELQGSDVAPHVGNTSFDDKHHTWAVKLAMIQPFCLVWTLSQKLHDTRNEQLTPTELLRMLLDEKQNDRK